jgi:cell pole-organizing protein PopZ
MGKAQAAKQQPSIDDLLASIRRAIHERVPPDAPGTPAAQPRKPSLVHPASPAGPETGQQEGGRKRSLATGDQDGFAGLLGGDVRLEEALARLNQSNGSRGAASTSAEPPRPEPRLRPTINPAPPAASASTPPSWRAAPVPSAAERQTERRDDRAAPARQPASLARQSPSPRPDRATHAFPPPPVGVQSPDLLSTEAASAAHSAFSRLSEAVGSRTAGGESSLDQLTRDCLRPLLKDWLDRNLPGVVERLVREEIERVARRGK